MRRPRPKRRVFPYLLVALAAGIIMTLCLPQGLLIGLLSAAIIAICVICCL